MRLHLSESDPQEGSAIVQEALRAAVVINAIDAKGLYAETPGRPLDEPSEATKLSPSSMFYEASSLGEPWESQDAAVAGFTKALEACSFATTTISIFGCIETGVIPEVAYLVGFPPADDGNYHKLKIS